MNRKTKQFRVECLNLLVSTIYTQRKNKNQTKKKPPDKYLRQLDANAIMHLDGISFVHLKNLRTLRIDGNMLQRVPTEALTVLPALEVL